MATHKNAIDLHDFHRRAQAWHSLAALQMSPEARVRGLFTRIKVHAGKPSASFSGVVPLDCLTLLPKVMD